MERVGQVSEFCIHNRDATVAITALLFVVVAVAFALAVWGAAAVPVSAVDKKAFRGGMAALAALLGATMVVLLVTAVALAVISCRGKYADAQPFW
jgi:hypothetical protein